MHSVCWTSPFESCETKRSKELPALRLGVSHPMESTPHKRCYAPVDRHWPAWWFLGSQSIHGPSHLYFCRRFANCGWNPSFVNITTSSLINHDLTCPCFWWALEETSGISELPTMDRAWLKIHTYEWALIFFGWGNARSLQTTNLNCDQVSTVITGSININRSPLQLKKCRNVH